MPRRDGTGPQGVGSRTGRGLGNCAGEQTPTQGLGFQRGSGRGLGCRRGFGRANASDQTSAKTERDLLTEKKKLLQEQLNAIDQQLEDL
jgi:hypothetical protein